MAPPRRACSSGYFPDAPVPLAWQVILSRRLCAARSISFCTKSCASAFMSPGIANALMIARWRCAEMSATGLGREAEHSPVDLLASRRQRCDVVRDYQNRGQKGSRRNKRPGNPEPENEVPVGEGEPEAVRGSEFGRRAAPRTAADDTKAAIVASMWRICTLIGCPSSN